MNNVDLLEEDRPISEQKFVCLSFVSPEFLIKKKELFYFEEFVSQYDTNKSMTKFNEFINIIFLLKSSTKNTSHLSIHSKVP
jgi:hypothetical protein